MAKIGRPSTKVTCICQNCGKEFEVKPYRADTAKYCSKKCTDEANRGVPKSDETRKKMSEANRGVTKSEETRKKMSEAKTGENHPMYGRRTGEFHTCPVCQREFYVYPSGIALNRGIYCSQSCAFRGKEPTAIEKAMMAALETMGLDYIFQYQFDGFPKIYDFYVSGSLIECDGDYFHDEKHFPGVTANDKLKTEYAREHNICLYRWSESEINDWGALTLLSEKIEMDVEVPGYQYV